MKPIKINESERNIILKLHNSKILSEEATGGKTIADLQKLLNVTTDNKLGPVTLAAIKTKLALPDKDVTPKTAEQPKTTEQPKAEEQTKVPDVVNIARKELSAITTAPTESGYNLQTKTVGGEKSDSKPEVDSTAP